MWDASKSPGDLITSSDWNDMVSDQKNHSSRHSDGGGDELDAADLAGGLGTNGQVLQSDGSAASWVDFQSGSDVSDDGSLVVSAPSDINFGNQLDVTDDSDGTVTVDANVSTESTTTVSSNHTTSGETTVFASETFSLSSWELNDAEFTGKTFTADTDITANIFWKPDGNTFWDIDSTGIVHEYSVSTAWDLSTASSTGISNNIGPSNDGEGLFWKDDGTKLWLVSGGSAGLQEIVEYDVSTAWDVTTASQNTTISAQDAFPTGIFWKPDGTKFWECGRTGQFSGGTVYEYDVGTAWDLTSASYSGTSFTVETTGTNDIFWKDDGTKFWGIGDNVINEYDVGTAWDLSTASFSNTNLDTDESGTGIFWRRSDGAKFWTSTDSEPGMFFEYELKIPLTITLSSNDVADGKIVRVVDSGGNADTNTLTVDTEGSETINGESDAFINSDYEALTFQSDGSNWFVVSRMDGGEVQ